MARKQLELRKRILIVCEGETEVEYFLGFKRDNAYKLKLTATEIYKPVDHSPLGLVNEAKMRVTKANRENESFDSVWIIFDRDRHTKIPTAFSNIEDFKVSIDSETQIEIIFSVICFEFWILLHFEKTLRPFHDKDEIVRYIKKNHYPECEILKGHYDRLYPLMDTAKKNNLWVIKSTELDLSNGQKRYDLSAYTDVFKLVEYLISQ